MTEGLFDGGSGRVVRETESGYKPGSDELTVFDGSTKLSCREAEVEVPFCERLLPLKVVTARFPVEPK